VWDVRAGGAGLGLSWHRWLRAGVMSALAPDWHRAPECEADMRVRALGAMAVAVGAVMIAGCGVKTVSATVPPGTTRAPVSSDCVTPKLTQSGKTFTITEKDNGKTYCVLAGTSMFVFLHGTPSRMWSHVKASSGALQPRPSGVFSLARGVTGAYYLAARLGHATLESSRLLCHPAASAGQATCGAESLFRVTILIRGRM
jgi:hypothetical protein